MESTLENRYGWLLLTYPARYRHARGAEMVGTLMESSRPGQRWPTLADAVDLLAGGLRHRAGLSAVPGLARGLALAGPIALVFAGGMGGYYLIAEFIGSAQGLVRTGYRGWGPLPTLGPIVYGAWVLAVVGRAALPRLASRWLIGAALAVTVLVVPVAQALDRTRPTLPFLVPVALLGLLALVGTVHAPPVRERAAVAVGLPATVGALIGLTYWHYDNVVYVTPLDEGADAAPLVANPIALAWAAGAALTVAGMAMLALLLGLTVAAVRWRHALWAAALLLVPGLPLVALLASELTAYQYSAWVLMPPGLAAGVLVLAAAVRLAWRDPASDGNPAPGRTAAASLAAAGTFALGAAAGVAGLAFALRWYDPYAYGDAMVDLRWRGYAAAAWPLAAVTSAYLPRWGARAAVALAMAVTAVPAPPTAELMSVLPGPFETVQGTLLALGVVAFAGLPAERPDRPLSRLAGVAAAAALCGLVVVGPMWWVSGSSQSPYGVVLGALVAFTAGTIAGGRAMLEPMSEAWVRGAAVLLASTGWIGVAAPRYLGSWQRPLILVGLVAVIAAAAVWAARRAPASRPPDEPA